MALYGVDVIFIKIKFNPLKLFTIEFWQATKTICMFLFYD